jgi:uncharacterized FAD-dependent dehydrogenase
MESIDHGASTERWRVHGLVRQLGEDESLVFARAAERLGLGATHIEGARVVRRSIDARGRRAPRFEYVVELDAPSDAGIEPHPGRVERAPRVEILPVPRFSPDRARPVVLGMGPAGLFAAMQLAEAGLQPVVIDRGRPVETRARDVSRLMGLGIIDPESNLCFGEGGAGTWSDGKLYTRVGGPRVREVLQTLVRLGAPDRILVDGRPHLGTDRLVALLKAFRAALGQMGCTLRFESRVEDLTFDRAGRLQAVVLQDGESIPCTHLVLAPGHSARDLYRTLAGHGLAMVPKAFAVGHRIEHPQAMINALQYGQWADHPELPAAYYELTAQVGDGAAQRGCYSFCMCPGGSVVPTPTREGEVCVNGMSHAARSGTWANSALVVTVEPEDFAGHAASSDAIDRLLAGVRFQQQAEAQAWERGGGAFVAPAQRVVDALQGRVSREVRRTSYKRGVLAADLSGCYPAAVHRSLMRALGMFERRMPGYAGEDAVLIGVETRTSAPVSMLRDRQTLQSVSHPDIWPTGEGAGHGGGIVSAAIDGLRVADAVLGALAQAPVAALPRRV